MPRLDYRRDDLHIGLRRANAELRITASSGSRHIERTCAFEAGQDIGTLFPTSTAALREALTPLLPHWTGLSPSDETLIPRVVLRIGDPDIAGFPWEAACAEILGSPSGRFAIVRDTPVRPRAETVGWTLPLRILHVSGNVEEHDVQRRLHAVFGGLPAADIDAAVRVQNLTLEELSRWQPSPTWPTAEVIHFDQVPALRSPRMLSTAVDAEVGTLGWLARFTDGAQTRLVVVRCATDSETRAALRLAQALVDRAGPAIFVLRTDTGEPLGRLYDFLVHDRPLDWIYRELVGDKPEDVALFAGAGREEALRVSGPAAMLVELAEALRQPGSAAKAERELRDLAAAQEMAADAPRLEDRMADLRRSLETLREGWGELAFHHHESEGYIPSARVLRQIRDLTFGSGSAPVRLGRGGFVERSGASEEAPAEDPDRPRRAGPKEEDKGRVVNLSISADEGAKVPIRIAQRNARLVRGHCYQLGVQVGAPDPEFRALDAAGILEETLKWRTGDKGAWLEVAVTGITFDVAGDPVQDLWLPRDGDTDLLRFTIIPRGEEVSVLRVCLYHRQNLVQSYRLASVTVPVENASPTSRSRTRLATALGVPLPRVGNAGWIARLEFSRVGTPDAIAGRPERALSIVANEVNGGKVVTVKGADVFGVETPGNLSENVQKIRDELSDIATPRMENMRRDLWPYDFGRDGFRNRGDDETLKRALIRLAKAGWELYTQVIKRTDREGLRPLLAGSDRVIQVAHVLIDQVLPWSLIYDRAFTPGTLTDQDGNPVQPEACFAALPNENGELPDKRCGEHDQCLLHHRRPEGVVCPLGFWGFRHAVEIPPLQTPPTTNDGQAEADTVRAGSPVLLLGGLNTTIGQAADHKEALTGLYKELPGVLEWKDFEERGYQIINALNDPSLDIVYLYCHARGGRVDPSVSPCLEFSGVGGKPFPITAGDLAEGTIWEHRPLIILNGCGTVGFSPDALSPFLPILVRDRQAAGLLGTEIPVNEVLAAEFAENFLLSFLSGTSAGQALLNARRKLLAQKNPLGLIYTLYANADLSLARRPQEK